MLKQAFAATVAALTLASCATLVEPELQSAGAATGTITHLVRFETGKPVLGAVVYDERTNRRLGSTDAQGLASHKAFVGQRLRVVEPNYGQQQYVVVVERAMLKLDGPRLLTPDTQPGPTPGTWLTRWAN